MRILPWNRKTVTALAAVLIASHLAVADPEANVYEGLNYNTNLFIVPDYRLSKNLVQNPGFEDGLDYWSFNSLGAMKEDRFGRDFTIDELAAWEGRRSLRIQGSKGQMPAMPTTFAIPTKPGTDYTLSFYAKADKVGVKLITHGTTDWWPDFVANGSFVLTTEWKRYTTTFKTNNKLAALSFWLNNPPEDCVAWVDGVQLEKGAEATEFAVPPAGICLVTATRENLCQPGDKVDGKLRIHAVPAHAKGEITVKVKDFFLRPVADATAKFDAGTDGVALMPLPQLEQLGPGMYVIEARLKTDAGFAATFFQRLAKMPYLSNTHLHKNLFAGAAQSNARDPEWERKFDLWKKIGIGSAVFFDPPPRPCMDILNKNKILIVPAVFDGGAWALDKKYRLDSRDANAKGIMDFPDDALPALEEEVYTRVKDYPEIKYWKTVNEPINRSSNEEEMRKMIKIVAAAHRGLVRAIPDAVSMTPDPAGMTPNGTITWLDDYLRLGGAAFNKAVGVHHYRQHPEEPDLDEDTALMIKTTDKHLPGGDVWITEGGYYMTHHLPAFKLDAFNSKSGGDHYRAGDHSYDLGIGERLATAFMARTWIILLKYADRVKQAVDWNAISGRLFFGIDMNPKATIFASNTLGNLLGDATFVRDIALADQVRCYLFEQKGRPVAAIWHVGMEVAKGEAPAPTLGLKSFAPSCEVIDLMGAAQTPPANGELPITAYPLFLRGESGKTGEFADALTACEARGAGSRSVSFLTRFASTEKIVAIVRNLLPKEIAGELTISGPDGAVLFKGRAVIPAKGSFERELAAPRASLAIQPYSLAFEFTRSESQVESGRVDLEYVLCPKAPRDITADGDLADWEDVPVMQLDRVCEWLPFTPELLKKYPVAPPRKGDDDFSASLRMAWSQEHFYFALEVKDDVIKVADKVDAAWQGDSLQLYFDSLGNARAKRTKGYDSDDQTYDVWFPQDAATVVYRRVAPEWQLCFNKHGIVPGVKTAFKKTEKGYLLEMDFPRKEIAPIKLEEGAIFGFSLLLNDNDGDYRKRGFTLSPPTLEPYQNPHAYPLMILGGVSGTK